MRYFILEAVSLEFGECDHLISQTYKYLYEIIEEIIYELIQIMYLVKPTNAVRYFWPVSNITQ